MREYISVTYGSDTAFNLDARRRHRDGWEVVTAKYGDSVSVGGGTAFTPLGGETQAGFYANRSAEIRVMWSREDGDDDGRR